MFLLIEYTPRGSKHNRDLLCCSEIIPFTSTKIESRRVNKSSWASLLVVSCSKHVKTADYGVDSFFLFSSFF
jgi:hypothetical protein